MGLNDAQRHHRVDFPSSIVGKMTSPVCFLIFERMTDIEERFAGNGDDGSLIQRQLFSRASVKRESRRRPTINSFSNLTPLRLGWYFTDHNSLFVSSRILKRDVKIAVRFDFESDNAACESKPLVFNPGAF